MTRFLWLGIVLLICLPVAVLATGVHVSWLDRMAGAPRLLPLSSLDQEMAWLHVTTSGTTWERFVSGFVRAQMAVPGLEVDDSNAFNDSTTTIPEVVLSLRGREGKLRIRWYKLTGEATTDHWIQALAKRERPPLAVIGGGSSDRAVDLARALDRQKVWHGDRPLMLLTTATADELKPEDYETDEPNVAKVLRPMRKNLIDVYDDRSFRFCFTNRQMAEAVLDFAWQSSRLHPEQPGLVATAAVASGLLMAVKPNLPATATPKVLSVVWKDDPFSTDLHERFGDALRGKAHLETWEVHYSIGGFSTPNFYEKKTAEAILSYCRENPAHHTVLVLPTVTTPARRLLRTIMESEPQLRDRLVVVTGDGIPINAFYRDGDFAWPIHAMPVPVVLFTHHNPVGWDTPDQHPQPPSGYELLPPNSTEDVLHFAEMGRVLAEACFPAPESTVRTVGGIITRADDLITQFRTRRPALFDDNGERLGGTGEYVVVVKPVSVEPNPAGRPRPDAKLEVYRRRADNGWEPIRTLEIEQRRGKSAFVPKLPRQPDDRTAAPPILGGRPG